MGVYFAAPLQTHQSPPEDERPKVYECNDCECDIKDGDGYYVVNGEIYCDECVEHNHHYAEAQEDYWEDDEE